MFLPATMRLYRGQEQIDFQRTELPFELQSELSAVAPGPAAPLAPGALELFEVSSSLFAKLRRYPRAYKLCADSFQNFVEDAQFLADVRTALERRALGPSYPKLKQAVMHAQPFLIITARGQSPSSIRQGLRLLIDATFTAEELAEVERAVGAAGHAGLDAYVLEQGIYPVSSRDFKRDFGVVQGDPAYTVEKGKALALTRHVRALVSKTGRASVGLLSSDDARRLQQSGVHVDAERERVGPTETKSQCGEGRAQGRAPEDGQAQDCEEDEANLLSIGFSDDDPRNLHAIEALFNTVLQPEVRLHYSLLST